MFGTTSAKSHREKETTEPSNLGDKAKDLVDFLNATKNNKKTPDAEPKPAPAPATWTMRMLKPGAVDDIQFEKTDDAAATSVGWKVTGSTAGVERRQCRLAAGQERACRRDGAGDRAARAAEGTREEAQGTG